MSAFSAGDVTWAVAGIGQPAQFFATLKSLDIEFEARVFTDHHRYCEDDFSGLSGRTILMTEKDAVKCRTLAGDDAWFLRIDALLPEGLVEALAALIRP